MNKLFKNLSFLAVIALFTSACGARAVQAQPEEQAAPKAITYATTLGKSLNDKDVAEFIDSGGCRASGPFQVCPSIGVVLWADANQAIKTAYLYLSNADGFTPYSGELPFDLKLSDTRANVEQKLGQPNIAQVLEAGWEPGLPNKDETHDHLQYWAVHKDFGVTIVYNTALANDKDATIHAIIVSQ